MDVHKKIRKIWKDPVGSKLISMGIAAAIGALALSLSNLDWSNNLKNPVFWIIGLLSLLAAGFVVFYILNYIILGEESDAQVEANNLSVQEIKEDIDLIGYDKEPLEEKVPIPNEEETNIPYNWLDSDTLFAQCMAQTFPGVRDIVWFNSTDSVRRLNLFFEHLRRIEPNGDVVWWRRGNQAFSVKNAEILDIDKIFLGTDRFKISRIAVFVSQSYYKHFIYVEADAEPTTGLYPEITEAYIQSAKERRGYVSEEYGEFNGEIISRQEYDDGASVHDNNVIQHNGMAVLRVRYLTKINFILTAKNSPYNNRKFEIGSVELFNDALQSEENIHKLFQFMDTFQKSDMPENRHM